MLGLRRSYPEEPGDPSTTEGRTGNSLLATLSLGHMAIHWYQQLWPIALPSIKESLGLTDVQVGTLASIKQFTTGPLFLPAGILADFFRRRTALILAASFLFLGGSYALVAQGSAYVWVIPGVALLGVGTALWHPTAAGALSIRYAERRGTALAFHGVGASIGDTVAPVAIGALLAILTWQGLLRANMIPALLIAFVLWRIMGKIYHVSEAGRPELRSYMIDAKNMLRHRLVVVVIGVMILTTAARLGIMTFLPIYIQQDLEYSTLELGFYWGLLHAMGRHLPTGHGLPVGQIRPQSCADAKPGPVRPPLRRALGGRLGNPIHTGHRRSRIVLLRSSDADDGDGDGRRRRARAGVVHGHHDDIHAAPSAPQPAACRVLGGGVWHQIGLLVCRLAHASSGAVGGRRAGAENGETDAAHLRVEFRLWKANVCRLRAGGPMLFIHNDVVQEVLTMAECISSQEEAFLGMVTGDSVHRGRIDVMAPCDREDGYYRWGTMEGASNTLGVFAIRMKSDIVYWPTHEDGGRTEEKYCVEPGSFCGLVFLFSTRNGEPLAIINDGHLQHMRVGGGAGLGVKYLSREESQTVGMIGSGGMARTYLEAFCCVRDIRKVKVYSPTKANREAYAAEMSRKLELEVEPLDNPRDVVRGVDIVSTCTDSMKPVIEPDWLEPGQHVTNLSHVESHPGIIDRADVVIQQGQSTHLCLGRQRRGRGDGSGSQHGGIHSGKPRGAEAAAAVQPRLCEGEALPVLHRAGKGRSARPHQPGSNHPVPQHGLPGPSVRRRGFGGVPRGPSAGHGPGTSHRVVSAGYPRLGGLFESNAFRFTTCAGMRKPRLASHRPDVHRAKISYRLLGAAPL